MILIINNILFESHHTLDLQMQIEGGANGAVELAVLFLGGKLYS